MTPDQMCVVQFYLAFILLTIIYTFAVLMDFSKHLLTGLV